MIAEIVNQLERILEYVENIERRVAVLEEECLSADEFVMVNSGEDKLRCVKKRLDAKYIPPRGISHLKTEDST